MNTTAVASASSASIETLTPKASPSDSSPLIQSIFEGCRRVQAEKLALGEEVHIPKVLLLGARGDGKSSLLEAILGFRFNTMDIGTTRPLVLNLIQNPKANVPLYSFKSEANGSEEYGPYTFYEGIKDTMRIRMEYLLNRNQDSVSEEELVVNVASREFPSITFIEAPGLIMQEKLGQHADTFAKVLHIVKEYAVRRDRILLFIQQSSTPWCNSQSIDFIRDVDPSFDRTLLVITKFDNKLKELVDSKVLHRYFDVTGYLPNNVFPYYVALPMKKDKARIQDFREEISQMDSEMINRLSGKDGFNKEKFIPYIGFNSFRKGLDNLFIKWYTEEWWKKANVKAQSGDLSWSGFWGELMARFGDSKTIKGTVSSVSRNVSHCAEGISRGAETVVKIGEMVTDGPNVVTNVAEDVAFYSEKTSVVTGIIADELEE